MQVQTILSLFPLTLVLGCAITPYSGGNDTSTQVEKLLSQMTLQEKIGQMTQLDFAMIAATTHINPNNPVDQAKLEDALLNHHVGSILNAPYTPYSKAQTRQTWQAIIKTLQATTAKSRLKIPVLYGIDAIHGATYTQNATLFPQAINMAATFNPALSYQEGAITAKELRASGLQWNFSPMLDIGRQPLWSRLWESYGEDVHLASVLGTAFIQGHQGDNFAAPDKALTCLKHFVGYSMPNNGKDRTPAWLSERMLREYFLPTFAAGITAGAPTIMVNSGEVDGIPGHANHHYLTDILRDELGFKGFTVSDWADIKNLYRRDKLAASEKEAVKMAVMAGIDMSMVPFDYSFYDLLIALVQEGEVPIARIDEAVRRILTVKYQAGLFAAQPAMTAPSAQADAEALAINRQAAHESIVLAKNATHLLPLNKSARIFVTGPTANLLSALNGGWTITWQGDDESAYPADKQTVLEAIQQQATGPVTYVDSATLAANNGLQQAAATAAKHDVIILCLGEKPYTETIGNISSLNLDPAQYQLAKAMISTGKPVVLVTLGGRPRIITEIAQQATAVVLGFLPGMEGGTAIADILFGAYNPDGKLPISYPRDTNDHVLYDHKPSEAFEFNRYTPLYPFGHGLSYTEFQTSGLQVAKKSILLGETLDVAVTVKNTGSLTGKETVLLYINDVAASVTRPTKQLKAFQKVSLAPGQSQRLSFTLTALDLSFIGVDLKRIVEPGEFKVMVGKESAAFWVEK